MKKNAFEVVGISRCYPDLLAAVHAAIARARRLHKPAYVRCPSAGAHCCWRVHTWGMFTPCSADTIEA